MSLTNRKNKKGVNTVISEDGKNFSGGQKQRIAIARALFHNKQILILDEATSQLDSKTDTFIQHAIKKLKEHLTLIIISHKPSHMSFTDHIIVLENGHIKKQGTYSSLFK